MTVEERRVPELEKGARVKKTDRNLVFISYSREDSDWRQLLRKHLKPFERAGSIVVWDDTHIPTGGDWQEHIAAALTSARVGVLLVSPNYLDSDFIDEHELPLLLGGAQTGDVAIVWIPVSASAVHRTPITAYQAAWDPEAPLDSLTKSEQNEALVRISDLIERAFLRPHTLLPRRSMDPACRFPTSGDAATVCRDGLPAGSHRNVPRAIGIPSREPTTDELVEGFRRLSSPLLDLLVPADDWISRPEEEQLRELLGGKETRGVCLLGGPGSGKTALLAKLGVDASQAGSVVVAIKADVVSPDESLWSWAYHRLGLDTTLVDGIITASALGKVVVLVDQLDALASLADVSPERLNDLLALIRQCQSIPNVTVVCSCRELEYRRDTRLSHLELDSVTLELPSWEQVSCELKKAGIREPDVWPVSFREVLRTPQHLHVYLHRFRETGQTDVFRTYQQMLDDLWKRKIDTPARKEFVYRLTNSLIDRETLWAPAIMFEDDERIVEQLEREEVIQRQDLQIGFRHQTLLEHAKARLFTKSGQSLTDHVLSHQDAIFVRPTIYSVLRYLRDADRPKYRQEIEALLRAQPRLHVRFLLIDFLGHVSDPEEFEVLLLTERLSNPEDRWRVLIAIRGNEPWFRALRSTQFPIVMRWELPDPWPMIGVIEEAWHFAHDECLRLVEDYWLDDPARDELTWRALHAVDRWDQRAVDAVRRVVRRAEDPRLWWAEDLVYVISADQPQLAPQVLAAVLQRGLRAAQDGDSGSRQDGESSFKIPRSLHSPLENSQDWHELSAVAEAAPTEFLQATWCWFTSVAVQFHSDRPSSVLREYGGWTSIFDEEEVGLRRPLALAIRTAVEKTAASDPESFVKITRPAWGIENGLIQNLLARGLAAVALRMPEVALDFLCADPRRFFLGHYRIGEQSNSIALITALAPQLGEMGLRRLEGAILSWTRYWPDAELVDRHQAAEREARLRLLKAIPDRLLTPTTAAFVRREEAELPDWDRKPYCGGHAGYVKEIPPLTKEQMTTATDEQILDVLAGDLDGDRSKQQWHEDERGWVRPGGARAAAQEVATLAKEQPERVLPLLPKLIADGNESPAADIMRSLEGSSLTDEQVYRLVRELAAQGAQSEDFRSDAAYLLYRRCRENTGLPDDICDIVERWLAMPWDSSYGISPARDGAESQESRELVSVLWAPGGGVLDTDRSFWPLLAVTNGYLMRAPSATERWLSMLERHLDRDIAEHTWAGYSSELRLIGLENCDRVRGVAVIRKLFDRFPSIKTSAEGIRLVALVAHLLPDALLRSFLDDLSRSDSPQARVGLGELLPLVAFGRAARGWVAPLLDEHVRAYQREADTTTETVAVGIGYSAAHGWDEPAVRPHATRLLCQLIPHAVGRVVDAIGTVFWAKEDFPADSDTELLLRTLAEHPHALSGRNVTDLVAHLAKLLPHQRRVVLAVCRTIVERRGLELTSISYELFSAGPNLVNIAMTLQRFPDTRSDGLTLLESLLRLGLDDAFAVLQEVDIRPGRGQTP